MPNGRQSRLECVYRLIFQLELLYGFTIVCRIRALITERLGQGQGGQCDMESIAAALNIIAQLSRSSIQVFTSKSILLMRSASS